LLNTLAEGQKKEASGSSATQSDLKKLSDSAEQAVWATKVIDTIINAPKP
jgi:hypothetical protein